MDAVVSIFDYVDGKFVHLTRAFFVGPSIRYGYGHGASYGYGHGLGYGNHDLRAQGNGRGGYAGDNL